jgi:signal peptidase I
MMPEQSPHNEGRENTGSSLDKGKKLVSKLNEFGKIILMTLLAALMLKVFVVEAYRIPSMSMENTLQIGDYLLVNKLAYGLRSPRHIPFTTASLPSFTFPFFRSVHRGDIVVFEFPGTQFEVKPVESVNYIKRCIGLPGDTVEIRFGNVFVNGIEASFPFYGRRTSHPINQAVRHNAEIFPDGSGFSDVHYGPVIVPKRNDSLTITPATFSQWHILIEREGHTVQLSSDSIFIDGVTASAYRVQQNYYFTLGDNRDNSMDSRYWGFVPDDHLIGEALFIYWSWDPDIPVYSISDKYSTIRWNRIGTLIR